MPEKAFNVLFLCTGNSARSILAEAILNQVGAGRFHGYSAGSHPSGAVNPLVLEFLDRRRIPAPGARSKSWDEFAAPGAPKLDFVITVCDQAAGEVCPIWPGRPMTAHWGVEDPAKYMDEPEKARKAIQEAFRILHRRIRLFASLPMDKLDRIALEAAARHIGKTN
jgi:protein-tyrosine-phosphatase